MTEAPQVQDEAMFLKFIGPMATLTQGKNKFIREHIYKVFDKERGLDMIDTGRFQQTRDPSVLAEKNAPRRGVRINTKRETREEAEAAGRPPEGLSSERGDMSQADLTRAGSADHREAEEVQEAHTPRDDHPRLPSGAFTSKKGAIAWADKNLGLTLDRNRSITELNRLVVEAYGRKFGAADGAEELDEDDTRDENTQVGAVVVV